MKLRTMFIVALLFGIAVCGLGMLTGRFLVTLIVKGLVGQ